MSVFLRGQFWDSRRRAKLHQQQRPAVHRYQRAWRALAEPLVVAHETLPMRLGDLSVGFVHSLADAMRSHGVDPQPCSNNTAWTQRDSAKRCATVDPRYMRLGHGAIQLTDNPALGLRMGRYSRLSQAGLAGLPPPRRRPCAKRHVA
jgi:hypothetical protein